jgi:hypothetical protein
MPLALPLSLLLALLTPPQAVEDQPPAPRPPSGWTTPAEAPPLPEPGVLPEGTAPGAAQLWERLRASTLDDASLGEGTRAPVRGFRVVFDLTTRGDDRSTNDVRVQAKYLAPAGGPRMVRARLEGERGGGRIIGKDERGYWLLDPKQPIGRRVVRFEGREYEEDRRQIEDILSISRNVVSLTDFSGVRLARLELAAPPPAPHVPAPLRRVADALLWLEVASPDLTLPGAPRSTGAPRLAMIRPPLTLAEARENLPEEARTGHLVELGTRIAVDGYAFPGSVLVYRIRVPEGSSPGTPALAERRAHQELWIKQGSARLAPPPEPEEFVPVER